MIKVAIAGHFNPPHIGHIKLVREAKKLGDHLTVIIANEKQAKRKRPVVFMDTLHRMALMYNMKGVDAVMESIDEDTNVCWSLERLRPDIFAMGCDKDHPDAIAEAKVCENLGIKCVYKVGGEKINSSSEILKKYVQDTSK